MLKKVALAGFGLVLAFTFMAPPKAAAQVHVGVAIEEPAVVVEAPPVVVYDEPYYVSHDWDSGLHEGYYYGGGTRYQMDERGNKQYDDRFRDGRAARGHKDHEDNREDRHEDRH